MSTSLNPDPPTLAVCADSITGLFLIARFAFGDTIGSPRHWGSGRTSKSKSTGKRRAPTQAEIEAAKADALADPDDNRTIYFDIQHIVTGVKRSPEFGK